MSIIHKTLLILFAFLVFSTLNASPLNTSITYQGDLIDAGGPAEGQYDFEFELWDDAIAGNRIGSTVVVNNVTVVEGIFTVSLDFDAGTFDGDDLWLRILVRKTGTALLTELLPRQALTAAPYAHHAESVPAGSITDVEIDSSRVQARITGICPVGQYIRSIGSSGVVTCASDVDTDTKYTAGTGLKLVTGQFSVDPAIVQTRVSGVCAVGKYISAIYENGTVQCRAPTVSCTDVSGPISDTADGATSTVSCAEDQMLTNCSCLSPQGLCDGSYTQANAKQCVAVNGAGAGWSQALASCCTF